VSGHTLRTAVLIAVPFAVVVAAAMWVAAAEHIVKVEQILNDPAAIHVAPKGTDR
jgi:hypothetical protein